MGTKTFYEWSYQCIDQHDDIIEHYFVDHLNDLPEDPCCGADDCAKHDLELWRAIWDTVDGSLLIREYALVANGKLPEFFDDGAGNRVPKRFHEEVQKVGIHV